ncbi:MAG: hypothetical protein AMXMBFR47_06950 [Planctomycetota bacterium]
MNEGEELEDGELVMRRSAFLALLIYSSSCCADITLSVDLVDPTDNITQPPPGVIAVDVLIDVDREDLWTAGGLRGVVTPEGQALGVTIRYAGTDDPNTPIDDRLFNPGAANRFSTFVTQPRNRDATGRYTNGNAGYAGRYSPPGPTAVSTSNEVNIAWFRPNNEPPRLGVDGAVTRISLDVGAIIGEDPDSVFFAGSQSEATGPIIFLSATDTGTPGTVSASFAHPQLVGLDWAIWYVPEPGMLAPFAVGFCVLPFRAVTRR